jgi:tetratricopeptide (TPR) repeat protein
MLEHAFEDMVKRYDFKPKTPLILELYESSELYSVRTIGLPNLGALGVCFGQVITAMSPSVGNINWAMVLWHELSHVFAIQLSNSRVPRWFTEGLSEYETIRARPEWRRENDSDLWGALQDKTLPSVAELNHAFMRPSMQEVVVAYHLSSVTIEYLVGRYGFPKIVEALKLFGKGKETPEVIEKITGKSVAQFDKEFREHLLRRLAPYRNSLHLPSTGMDDVAALAKAAKDNPKDAQAQARAALGQFYNGDAPKAAASAAKAMKLDPKNATALYVSAELAMKGRKVKEATKLYEALIRGGSDSFDVRVRLSMLAGHTKDNKSFVAHLETAKTLDPERSYPYETLAEFYSSQGNTNKAIAELETYVMIEQMSLGPLVRLVDEFSKQKKWHKVIHYAELGINIDPAKGGLQLSIGKAYLNVDDAKKALFAYDTALLIRPRLRRPALAHLGRAKALLALAQKSKAKSALDDALDLEPENAEAIKMRAALP